MRRLLPWALVALVGAGAASGAALGQANAPGTTSGSVLVGAAAQQWLAGVLAATKNSGTAHLAYRSVEVSPNPLLRGSSSGSGVVDFAAGTFRTSETDDSQKWSTENGAPVHAHAQTTREADIGIGSTLYQNFGEGNALSNWVKTRDGRNGGALGLASADSFGGVLSALTGQVATVSVRALGPAAVDGSPATRYLVRTELQPFCPRPKRTVPAQSTMVWVDGRGRLVQARTSIFISASFDASIFKADPAFAHFPVGPRIFTSTLRLSAFGAPVRVATPTVRPSGTSVSIGIEGTGPAVFGCG